MGKCNGCDDPTPIVNDESVECCELTPSDCVVTSSYTDFLRIGKGRTLTHVINVIAKFLKKLTARVTVLEDSMSQIQSSVRPYNVYTARVFQQSTDEPESTIMENTLSGVPVWSRDGAGDYFLTLTGEFTNDKTWVIGTNENSSQNVIAYYNDIDSIGMFTESGTDGNVSFSIEIRVYD